MTDAKNYVATLVKLRDGGNDAAQRSETMAAFDAEVVIRGAEAVSQSLSEAEKSLDPAAISGMLMMNKGFTKTA